MKHRCHLHCLVDPNYHRQCRNYQCCSSRSASCNVIREADAMMEPGRLCSLAGRARPAARRQELYPQHLTTDYVIFVYCIRKGKYNSSCQYLTLGGAVHRIAVSLHSKHGNILGRFRALQWVIDRAVSGGTVTKGLNKCHNKVIIIFTNCQVGNDVQYGTKIIIAIVVQKLYIC